MPDDPTLQTTQIGELEEEPTAPTTEPTAPAEPTEPEPQDDLRAAMTELAGTVKRIAEPPPAAAPPPTAAEIAEFWAVYDPEQSNKDFFKQWFRLNPDATQEEVDNAKALFAGVQKGLMKQSVTATQNYLKQMRAEIDQEYAPLRDYVQTAQRREIRSRFDGEYPALKEAKFNKIIDATARSLDGKTFADESEYFKALAEGAADSIRAILPEFDLGARPTTKTKPGQTPKLPRTSAGGGGGAGKGALDDLQPTGRKNDIDSLEEDS